MPDLLLAYGACFSLIAVLYYWARRNRRQGWRRQRLGFFYTETPSTMARRPGLPVADVVSLADSLLALNRALETSVSPESSPAPSEVHDRPR